MSLEELARRYVWWKSPIEALSDRTHLLCQLMQLGNDDDVQFARGVYGDDAFREALRTAPPGLLDAQSWNFWHLFWFKSPPPPMPTRTLPE